jgi:hypothetical protein
VSDRIEFDALASREGDSSLGIRIRINGRDLRDLLREVETPFAAAENVPEIAGLYTGLPLDRYTRPPSRHFLGAPLHALYIYGTKTQILQCECGEPGCWPLLCRIEASDAHVAWSGFEQPHRGPGRTPAAWAYETLGPFSFERGQFEAALALLGQGGNEARDA